MDIEKKISIPSQIFSADMAKLATTLYLLIEYNSALNFAVKY